MDQREYQDLLEKYKARIKGEFGSASAVSPKVTTKEYSDFKSELYPGHYSMRKPVILLTIFSNFLSIQ